MPFSTRLHYECMVTDVADDEIAARIETKDGNSIEDGIQQAFFSPDEITRETDDEEPFRVADRLEWILVPEQNTDSCGGQSSIDGIPVQTFVTESLRRIQRAPQITQEQIQQTLETAREAREEQLS